MEIRTNGDSRLVFLIGKKAYKVARVKPLWFLLRVICWPFVGWLYKSTWSQGVYDYFIKNRICNKNEFLYFQEFADWRTVPTKQSFFFGLIVVQERGKSVTQAELENECPFYHDLTNCPNKAGVGHAAQYVRLECGIRLADFGSIGAVDRLRETLRVSLPLSVAA